MSDKYIMLYIYEGHTNRIVYLLRLPKGNYKFTFLCVKKVYSDIDHNDLKHKNIEIAKISTRHAIFIECSS